MLLCADAAAAADVVGVLLITRKYNFQIIVFVIDESVVVVSYEYVLNVREWFSTPLTPHTPYILLGEC